MANSNRLGSTQRINRAAAQIQVDLQQRNAWWLAVINARIDVVREKLRATGDLIDDPAAGTAGAGSGAADWAPPAGAGTAEDEGGWDGLLGQGEESGEP